MVADNNREDVTHVKIENISFNQWLIIYSEGLVTLYGCTLNAGIDIFMYKSQHEPDFTYKTAEMIPSAINNKTINMINTTFHHTLRMYLLSGIRTVNIISSVVDWGSLDLVVGNKSVDTVNSRHLKVLNISIINTTFTNYGTYYKAYGKDSIISMKTTHSTFNNSGIYQYKGAGYFGAVIEDTKFNRSRVLFEQVILVSMRNCEYEVSDNMFYDNVKISGNDHFLDEPEAIKQTIKQLICHSSHCEDYWLTISIENTILTGTLKKQTNSLIKTDQVSFIMRNVTFDIYQKGVNRKRWYISYTTDWSWMLLKLINVTINATSLPSASSVTMVSSTQFYLENFEIFCPQGLAIVNVSSELEEQFSCEKQCPTDAYTFQAGSAVINGNKHYQNSPYNITYGRSEVHCKVCPLGANCTGPIRALPNYWGYKDSKDDSVTMIRCPDGYCCTRNYTCDGLSSCNTNRSGNICGKCQQGLSEALFSTQCISADTCIGSIGLLYYTLCVIIYIAFLASYKDLQKYAAAKIKKLYKRIKDRQCLYWNNNAGSNSDEHNNKVEENIEVNEETHTHEQRRRKKSENDGSHDKNIIPDNKSDESTKYIQILFFYIQDALLFKIKIPHQNYQEKGTVEKILSFSPKILTLTYSRVIHTCFSYAETPVSKTLFEMFFGLYLVFIIWLLYLIVKFISKFLKKTSNIWAKFKSCLLRAFLLGMLFSYQNLVIGAFTLVRCVDIANIKVLHIKGDVQCYSWWQYLVMCYIIFFIIPVFLALSHFPHYIKDKNMSMKTFILSCLFPAPVMMHYVIKEIRRKIHLLYRVKFLTENIPIEILGPEKITLDCQVNFDVYVGPKDLDIPFIDEDSDGDKHSDLTSDEFSIAPSSNNRKENDAQISVDLPIMSVKTMSYSKSEMDILTALLEHYRELNLFGVRFTWLCIHKLYRVALVACNTFITEPIYRLCLMTLALIIVTVVDNIVKPYNDYKANLTASLSYAANLCLALLNIVRSVMITFDCKSNSSFQATVLWYFDLTENVLLSYIPCVVIAAWFVYTVAEKCSPKNKKD